MSKDYMKPGELREGDSLHFDGVGYYTRPTINHFKVNKWMLRNGFKWEVSENNTLGLWVKKGNSITQEQAVLFYEAVNKWWKFWL